MNIENEQFKMNSSILFWTTIIAAGNISSVSNAFFINSMALFNFSEPMINMTNITNPNELISSLPCANTTNITMQIAMETLAKQFATSLSKPTDLNKMFLNLMKSFKEALSHYMPNFKMIIPLFDKMQENIMLVINSTLANFKNLGTELIAPDKLNILYLNETNNINVKNDKIICLQQNWEVCNVSRIEPYVSFKQFTDKSGNYKTINTNQTSQCPNPNKPVKIIIHGYMDNGLEKWIKDINSEYCKEGQYNVISVDWSIPAASVIYSQSATNAKCIGEVTGKFIHFLQNTCNISCDKIHLIGHSLGAHISGFAGKYVRQVSQGSCYVKRITGLDTAGPCFCGRNCTERVCAGDAQIFENIHTDDTKFGCSENKADCDFYINGGHAIQPGCPILTLITGNSWYQKISCSHRISYLVFMNSIIKEHITAHLCPNEKKYNHKDCNSHKTQIVGKICNKKYHGKYYATYRG